MLWFKALRCGLNLLHLQDKLILGDFGVVGGRWQVGSVQGPRTLPCGTPA